MSDEMAQALISELAQIKVELGALRRELVVTGRLNSLPHWAALGIVLSGLMIWLGLLVGAWL